MKVALLVVMLIAGIGIGVYHVTAQGGGGGGGGAYGPSYRITNEHYYSNGIHEYDVKTDAPYTKRAIANVCREVEYHKDAAQFVKFPLRGHGASTQGAWCMMPHTQYGAQMLVQFMPARQANSEAIAGALESGKPYVNVY